MSNDKRVLIIVAIIGAAGAIIAAYIGIIPYLTQEPQLVTIQGKVTDENKMPVVGVTVGIDGLSDITGDEGKYCIRDVPAGIKAISVEKNRKEVYKRVFELEDGKEIRIFDISLTLQTHTATPTVTETNATTPSHTPPIMTLTPALTPTLAATKTVTELPATTPTPASPTMTPTPTQAPKEQDANGTDLWHMDQEGLHGVWD